MRVWNVLAAAALTTLACDSGTSCSESPLTPECTGDLSVTVTIDASPASGITVSIQGESSGSAVSDAQGIASFTGLEVGGYIVTVDDPQVDWAQNPITVSVARQQEATVSFTGSRMVGLIAFASDRTGDYEVYAIRPDGTGEQRLTNDAARDRGPSWSPDGGRLAFQSDRAGVGDDIWIINADGSGAERLTSDPSSVLPGWTLGPSRVSFSSNHEGNFEIYTVNPNGSETNRLTNDSNRDLAPNWSPSGDRLVFQSDRASPPTFEIWTVGSDGSNPQRLTTTGAGELTPSYSPDGTLIAFASDRDGAGIREIYVMNANGSNQERLTTFGARTTDPTWSPDGTRIAFQSDTDGDFEIYVIDLSTRAVEQITNNGDEDIEPSWGPPVGS